MASLVVRGGRLLTGDAPERLADVAISDGHITGLGKVADGTAVLDASRAFVVPGFIDTQLNGAVGVDLTQSPERLAEVATALPAHGVTAFLPTVVTSAPDRALRLLAAIDSHRHQCGMARVLGAHLEGPFLNPERRGAHDPRWLRRPSMDEVDAWLERGHLAMVTLAPELPGALEVIRRLCDAGVVVSAGHTATRTGDLVAAHRAGLRHVTHLFNAMPALHHRDPGIVGMVLGAPALGPALTAGLIADGVHVHPAVVALAQRALGPRLVLVSDAVSALGQPGARDAVWLRDGTLAGASAGLATGVANLVGFSGCTLAQAVDAAAGAPARLLGRADLGRLVVGAPADVVVLGADLAVRATIAAGEIAWQRA